MKFDDFQKACMEGGHEVPEIKSQYGVKPAEFMQTLGEAKMFRTRKQIENSGARDVADHAFVGILSLYVSNSGSVIPCSGLLIWECGCSSLTSADSISLSACSSLSLILTELQCFGSKTSASINKII